MCACACMCAHADVYRQGGLQRPSGIVGWATTITACLGFAESEDLYLVE